MSDKTFQECIDQVRIMNNYPPILAKACLDEYNYSAKLVTGETVNFVGADAIDSSWVHLRTDYHERGMDLAISSIMYLLDE